MRQASFAVGFKRFGKVVSVAAVAHGGARHLVLCKSAMEHVSPGPDGDESAHTTGRNGGYSKQVEIITRGERCRSWTVERKRELVRAFA